jgi:tripartite-type tricarboxylate transporter receptor subunit TctC
MMWRKVEMRLACALALCAAFTGAEAQLFPVKPVRIVVPFPAGGSFDVTARILAQRMQASFGQNVIVENRPGGGTVIGTEYVARQPADGYTMLMIGPSFTSHMVLRSKLAFDTDRDFQAVGQVIGLTMAISVNPSLPARNMKELVALAKARPGQISCGSSGTGTSHHLLLEALKLASKIDITHTPFQGAAYAVPAAVGGHITALLLNVSDMAPFIKTGKLRALVVTSAQREPEMPEVPTAAEAGHPEIEAINWSGFVAHSAVPPAAIARLNQETVKALNLPEVRELLRAQTVVPTPTTAAEFAALIKSDGDRYRRIIREANVRVE